MEQIFNQCYVFETPLNIVLANGEFPGDEYLSDLIGRADSLICCDGAVNSLESHNIEPTYIIGDCDSLTDDMKHKYKSKIRYIPDQNSNDLTKAVNFSINELGLSNLIILGANGLRDDHNLANIGLLAKYAVLDKDIIMLSDFGFFSVHDAKTIVKTVANQQISLFALTGQAIISTHGLKWDLDSSALDNLSSGTLNQALGTCFELQTIAPILVYRSFDIKKGLQKATP